MAGQSDNLVSNGEFTANTTGWTAVNNAVLASVAGGQSGNCLRITENGANDPKAKQDITVSTGALSYELTGWIKEGTETDHYRFCAYDRDNSAYLTSSTWINPPADWTKITLHFTKPRNCTQLRIYLDNHSALGEGKTLYFDTISLKQLPWGRFRRERYYYHIPTKD